MMALGLPDDPVNRFLAEQKAWQIEAHMRADRLAPGTFDVTLARYRDADPGAVSVVRLFERHIARLGKVLKFTMKTQQL